MINLACHKPFQLAARHSSERPQKAAAACEGALFVNLTQVLYIDFCFFSFVLIENSSNTTK